VRKCACVYMYMCVRTCACVGACVYIHTHTQVYMHIQKHTQTPTQMNLYVCCVSYIALEEESLSSHPVAAAVMLVLQSSVHCEYICIYVRMYIFMYIYTHM